MGTGGGRGNRKSLNEFRDIPWNQTTEVDGGSTLITQVLHDADVV